jgi:hypothetical protein
MEILTLQPFSQGEIVGVEEGFVDALFGKDLPSLSAGGDDKSRLFGRLLRGGYPASQERDAARRAAWFASYVTTILQRDVRELARIEGLTELPRLLHLLATRTMSLMNFADLSRETAIPQTTAKRYLALLETAFLVRRIPAWSSNLSKRLMKTPRIALLDAGLAAHLAGIGMERVMEEPGRAALLEPVAGELLKQCSWSRTRAAPTTPYVAGQEVDLPSRTRRASCSASRSRPRRRSPSPTPGLRVLRADGQALPRESCSTRARKAPPVQISPCRSARRGPWIQAEQGFGARGAARARGNNASSTAFDGTLETPRRARAMNANDQRGCWRSTTSSTSIVPASGTSTLAHPVAGEEPAIGTCTSTV